MKNGTYLVRLYDFKTKNETKDEVIYDCSTKFVACVDRLTNGDISKICSENNFSDEEPLVVVRIKDNSVTEYVGAVFKDYINNQIVIDKNLSIEV